MAKDRHLALTFSVFLASGLAAQASANLLQNPGFEQSEDPTPWSSLSDNGAPARVTESGAHAGRRCLALAANRAVQQRVDQVVPGAYLVRCWVKSDADQPITIVVQDAEVPAASYTYADLKVPKDRWVQVEAFCAVDRRGSVDIALGGMSEEFRKYHGGTSQMRAPVLIDDCEFVRFERTSADRARIWDAPKASSVGIVDWRSVASPAPVNDESHVFSATAVFQDSHLAGIVRPEDGALQLYAVEGESLVRRAVVVPHPAFAAAKASMVKSNGKSGIRVSADGGHSYTAWLSPEGVIDIEPDGTAEFRVQQCDLRYGLLPSFVGTDLCYAAGKLTKTDEVSLPSTQWFVGLRDGGASMLVLVWHSPDQAVALKLAGSGKGRLINSVSINTQKAGFSLSCVEHANLWREQPLDEDWLGEYVPLPWQRPFPARWMAEFFASPGGKASFRNPHMSYSFPVANAKTRMWGVWFEDWNHYPFYFDGSRLIAHFEKTFVPQDTALFYFLEPAAAEVVSPCEIVEQVLGDEKALALFDLEGNQLRKLQYSTPPAFMYDRPVCATTTRLSGITKDEKPTVGVNLATHLYEFIRDIRGRVNEYVAFFDDINGYLGAQEQAHPEMQPYVAQLRSIIAEGRARAKDAYDTPLAAVEAKTDAMKKLLSEGKGDGFDCGTLDVRGPAGTQDDLCRRYNRLVLRLCQTAALTCDNSPERAVVATHLWQESRKVLRQPTRWEPRRTLYFFEP